MLEPTHSDEVLLRSVKKFFIDTFADPEFLELDVFFDYVDRSPSRSGVEATEWMCVIPRKNNRDTLSKGDWQIHLFVKGDTDGLKLAKLRDSVVSKLIDFDATDGRIRLPFYDSQWNLQFFAVLGLKDDLGTFTLEAGLKTKILPFTLFWGAK